MLGFVKNEVQTFCNKGSTVFSNVRLCQKTKSKPLVTKGALFLVKEFPCSFKRSTNPDFMNLAKCHVFTAAKRSERFGVFSRTLQQIN